MNSVVKFGDLICLYSHEVKGKQMDGERIFEINNFAGENIAHGFLAGMGFTDDGIYIHELKDSDETLETLSTSRNFRQLIFQITPKLHSEAHDDCKKVMGYYKELIRNTKLNRLDHKKFTLMKKTLEKKISKLVIKMHLEKTRNEAIIKESLDTPISFGSEVQLMHYDSKTFICGSNECSQDMLIGYKCSLSQWFSKMMVFRMLPKLKSRNKGETIQYRDLVVFENVESNSFLSYCGNVPVKSFSPLRNQTQPNPFRPILNVNSNTTQTFECYLSLRLSTSFACVLHSSANKPPTEVYGQQMVRLVHSETLSKLAADIAYNRGQPEIYLLEDHPENPFASEGGTSLWEVEHQKLVDNGRPFRFDGLNEELELKHSSPVILKHVVSNLRMNLKRKETAAGASTHDLLKFTPFLEELTDEAKSEKNLWSGHHIYFYPLVKLHETLQVGSSSFISNGEYQFLKVENSKTYTRDRLHARFMKKAEQDRDRFEPLKESQINQRKFEINFSPGLSSKDTFLLKKVSDEEIYFVCYLRSAMQLLNHIAVFFKNPKMVNPSERRNLPGFIYQKVVRVLHKLSAFIFDKEEQSAEDGVLESHSDTAANKRKQQLLKDFGFIDVLMEIIYFPIRNAFFSLPELKPTCIMTPVMRACYSTLARCIQGFGPNELYASQWLNVIMDHSSNTGIENDIYVEATMQTLIDNNREVLETRITKEMIMGFIEKLKQDNGREEKNVVVLRAFCLCDGVAIIPNQKMLSELILNDSQARLAILVPMYQQAEDNIISIQIYIPEEKVFENLVTFIEDTRINTSRMRYYQYLLSIINLISEICFERNYLAIEALQDIYPINLCLYIMTKPKIPYEMREVFGKLMKHLWINVTPFYKVILPNPVKTFQGLTDKIAFSQSQGRRIIYDKVKTFIPQFIHTFTQMRIIQDLKEVKLLSTLLEIML